MITYIDMDGVIADFYAGAHNFMGIEVEGFPYKKGSWDWPKELGFKFRDAPVEFWADLPLCEDADHWLRNSRKAKLVIATCPSSHESIVGKSIWLKRHFPKLPVVFLEEKWMLAKEGQILIDDSLIQIDNFRKHGGHGVLVPRPWNGMG